MSEDPQVKNVTVVGAGTMGHGIAQMAAMAGYDVLITDSDPAAPSRAIDRIKKNLDGGLARGKLTADERDGAITRLSTAPDVGSAASNADLCIEAVVEDLDVKHSVFRSLAAHASDDTILATNTSSLPIAKIAEPIDHPERIIGMHFFNPVHIMPLVEVVVHDGTSESARVVALQTAARMGKVPIVVADSPGFATSRLGVVIALEAIRMVEQGVASAADIDRAMELGYKHPMGPLKLTDVVGLDVRLAIAETLHRELEGAHYEPPQMLRDKVAAGELGKKTGKGFYEWTE
ncbi:MAG: 3-hydroxyacyl-CoA dehydrogenase family protein [Candidatus Latescibacterota bacterium]|jgi:3-hydroxybutyryl-CoA dehydrogenase